jgi:PAS domain S-box-containing protein
VDQILFPSRIAALPISTLMAPNTALDFVFVGLGLILNTLTTSRAGRLAQTLFLLVNVSSLIALIGYGYGAPGMYTFTHFAPMSLPSSIVFQAVSIGGLFTRTDVGPSGLILSPLPGGILVRRVLLVAVVAPIILGWLRLEGQERGIFGHEVGTALMTAAVVGIMITVIWSTARVLDESERRRLQSEEALQKSLAWQRRLVESNIFGILTTDAQWRIIEANQAFLEIVGYTRDDLPMRSEILTPPEWVARTDRAKRDLVGQGIATPWEKEYIHKTGRRVPVLVGAAALPEGGAVALIHDLSAQKEAEAETKRMRLFLDSIVENLPSMVFVKDAESLRFVRVNKAAEDLLGLSREELLGKSDFDFFPETQAKLFVAHDRDVLNSGQLLEIPVESVATKHRGVKLLRTKKVPIVDELGRPQFLLGLSEDITEQRRTEERVQSLHEEVATHAQQLELAIKELEAFSYSVSHDLRAPLRHIMGFVDLLLRQNLEQLDATGQRRLTTIRESAQRMGQLIDDLLLFSRMGRTELQNSPMDLNKLLRAVLTDLEPETKDRRIQWKVQALPTVEGDPAMLRLVLTNLLSNAIKYTGTRPEAIIEVGSDEGLDGHIAVYVKDNGVGFDMEYEHKLFGVFQRLHGNEEFPGTGIGLANVRRIIHRHGGKTWAEGRVDQGATFYFSLPRGGKENERWAA